MQREWGKSVACLVVAAHPDDETVGAAIRLSRMDPLSITILHITNGSPRDLADARANGFETAETYEKARRAELHRAVSMIGLQPEQCLQLDVIDKEACHHLQFISTQIAALLRELQPALVLTHPYEGGHPDHDSASFAVQQAVDSASDIRRPAVLEFACYHAGPHGMVTGSFLETGDPTETIVLNEDERRLKQAMLDCFRSQQRVLAGFSIDRENFRPAPFYDFTKPPHAGTLHYENHGWGITGETWRVLANRILARA